MRNLRAVCLAAAAAVTSAQAATITWTGAASSFWTNSANWNPAQVPTNTDTAIINSGSVTFATNSVFSVLNFNAGNLFGPILVATNATLNWNGGRMDIGSSLTVQSNAAMNLLTATQKDLGGPMTNFGQVNLSGNNFYVLNDAGSWRGSVTNTGLWDMQADVPVNSYFGGANATFGNRGTFRKSAGTGIGVMGPSFFNGQGICDCESGTLRFDNGGRIDGSFVAGAGDTIAFNGGTFTYVPSNRLTGAGQYQLTGGTLQGLDDYLANLQLNGGTVLLAANYQTNGAIVRLDLNGATLGGSSNLVVGVLNVMNGGISSALEGAANSVINLNGTTLTGSTAVRSNATMNFYAGRFGQGSSLLIENGAVLNMPGGGEKDVGGPMINYGRVVMTSGTFYIITDNVSWLGSVLNLGSWEMQGDMTIVQYFGNDLATFVNAGLLRKTAGTGISSIGLTFLNGSGTLEAWTGAIQFDHGEQLDGLFIADAGGAIRFNAGTFTYTANTIFGGNGSFQIAGGAFNGLPDAFPNLQLLGGTVTLSPTFQTNGPIARLDLNGATLAGTYQVSGVLNFNSGFIAAAITVVSNSVLNWNSGRFSPGSSLLVNSNGFLNLASSGEKDIACVLTNYGTATWTGGTIYLMNDGGSYLGNIQNNGLWDTRGDLPINRWFGNDYTIFRNAGTLRKSTGSGTATYDVVTLNLAAVESLSGTLNFNRGLSCTAGSITFGLGSGGYGQISVIGTAGLNGGIAARLLNGFIPTVGQNFSVLSASSIAGTFTDTNGLRIGFGRALTAAYTPSTVTLQTIATNAVNNAPSLTAVPTLNVIEGQTLLYTNQASDPNGNQVFFQLTTAPSGAAVDLNTGILSWTPTEAQGGATYGFTLKAFDNGNPSTNATQSFNVVVAKTNSAPMLPVIPPQLIGVGGTLTVTNTATDTDLPAQTLTYALLSPPSGMTVNADGIISWAPSTPGNYVATMRVTDSGTPALSATNSFSVGVLAHAAPPAGLVSWWTGDGTTADQNGVNNGALSGAANYGPGLFGQAFNFTGGNLTVLDSASLDFQPGSAMTIEMWVRRSQAGAVPFFYGKRVSCGSYNYQSPSDLFSPGSAYDLPVGQWQHMAWVYTGTEMLSYVNGALVYHTETTLGPTNAAALFLGASGTCGQTFLGLIDDARIYNRALSSAEIQSVYSGSSVGGPVLTQQPSSQLAPSGANLTLTASATGAPTLSYQWYYNGVALAGKTTASLSLLAVTVGQSGTYTITVSNALGTVTSAPAEIVILNPPAITTQPQSQLGGVGGSITFSNAASGSAPLSYTWRKNGSSIGGGTGQTLTLNNVQTNDAGNYDVVVANWVGAVTSQVAVLTVNLPIVWTGAVSSDWTNSANWNPAQVPTSTDTAVINSGTVQLRTNSQFFALTLNGGNLTGPLVVRSNSVMNWNGGRLDIGSSLLVQSNATVLLLTATAKDLGGHMTNFGRVVLGGINFSVLNDGGSWQGTITNLGLWEMQGDLPILSYFGGAAATFGNSAIFRKTAGTGIGVMGVAFTNGLGTCDVEKGTLRFDNGGRLDGTFFAAAGSTIVFNAGTFTYVPANRLTGPGQYQLAGGTLNGLDDYLPSVQLNGGTVNLAPNYQTNGVIVRLDLNGATLGGTSNKVTGILNAVNGGINGVLETGSNAVLNINGTTLTGPTAIRAGATLNWYAGRFGQGSSLLVETGGLVNMPSGGEKDMGGPMSNYGRVVLSGGSFYVITDNSTWLGSVVNLGLFEMAGDCSIIQYFGNDLALFENGGIFRKSAGTGIGSFNMRLYNTYGSVEVWSGTLSFEHGQQLDGSYLVQGGAVLRLNGGAFTYTPPGRFTGSGVYQLNAGTLAGLTDFLPNWQLAGGTVTLAPNFQTNGPIVRLDLSGASLAGTNQVSGVLNFNSGTITGPLTVNSNAVLNWNSGRFGQGSSLVNSNGFVNLLTGGEKDLGGPLTNYGNITWTGGTFYVMNDGSSWQGAIQNYGLWDTRGDLPVSRWFGSDFANFQNYGVLRKSIGNGTFGMDVITTNAGSVEAMGSLISFTRGLSSTTGTLTFGISNNAGYGQISSVGTMPIGGSITARLLDGFIPNISQSFSVLSAGSISGAFSDTNGLVVGFGRILNPIYAANSVTLQAAATNGINNAPIWSPVPNFIIAEGQTLLYTNQVSDPDGDQVLFKLVSAPTGATLGITNGILNWTPTEAQGNSSNNFTARIFDSGNPSLAATQSFYVNVSKTNSAPALPAIALQYAGVGSLLTVTNTATDLDVPANVLTYSLLNAPGGMSVDTNGIITWTPSSAGTFPVTMRVVDNGTPPMSATNSFSVAVISAPVPPAGLVSWWSGDGTSADKQGPNPGALSGAAGYAPGLFGQAFNLNGGYLTVPDSVSLDFAPGSALTMEMWVKRTQAGPVPFFFGKRINCSGYNYESPSDFIAGADWNVPVGQWEHLAWVFTGTDLLAYVNGALVYQTEFALGPVNAAPLLIGASGTCGQSFVGLIDEVRLYNRALSGAEIQTVYNGQNVGAPVLTQEPASRLVASGSTVSLIASATGVAPLTYQWYFNGAPLAGATTNTLPLIGVTTAQSGTYTVTVSNTVGTATSDPAGLAVADAPVVTVDPQSQVGFVGGTATFTVTATGTPTPVLSYQWRKGGQSLAGQTGTSLTLNNLQVSDSGNFDVVVANWAGSATSHVASLLVTTPIVWTGASSSQWTNPANWNPQQIPTINDTVLINSGNVNFATNSQFLAMAVNGGNLSGPVVVQTNCAMYWNAGNLTQSGSMTVLSNGVVYLAGASQKNLSGPMTNFGRVVYSGGSFVMFNDNGSTSAGTITNTSLGTFDVQGDLTISQNFGNNLATFGNRGLYRKSGGSGINVIGVPFFNGQGTNDLESGTMRFDAGGRIEGAYFAAAGTIMLFNSGTFGYVPPNGFTGPGQYQFAGGTLQGLDDYVPNFQLLGGTVILSANYQTNGTIARLDLNGATLGGVSNRVTGVLNATNGSITGLLEITFAGVANLNGTYTYGFTALRGTAVMNWFGGRFAQGSSVLIESNAVMNLLSSAEKDFGGPVTNLGHINLGGGSLYVINDNSTWQGYVTNRGTFDMQGDFTVGDYFGNGLAWFGNGGTFRKSAGTGIGSVGTTFYNTSGTVDVESGTLRFDHGLRLDGNYIAAAGAVMAFNNGVFTYVPPSHFTGPGQYQLTGGTLQGLDNYLPNLFLLGGTVMLSPAYQTNGPIVRLDMNGATLSGTNKVIGVLNATNGGISGSLEISNGVANFSGTYAYGPVVVRTNSTLNWFGGRFAQGSSLLIEKGGLLNALGQPDKEMGSPMTNYGRVAWSAGNFVLITDNATWTGSVSNAGLWEMQGDLALNQYFGNDLARFGNAGMFRKTAGSGTGVISMLFNNGPGTNDVASGTLRFDHGQTLAGRLIAETGAIMQFNSGTFTYTPQTQLTGSGAYQLTGGLLQGLDNYLANLSLLGGNVQLSPIYQGNGLIHQLDLSGSTLLGSNRVSGTLNLFSGGLAGQLSISANGVFNWWAGQFGPGSSLTIDTNGLANLTSSSEKILGGLFSNGGQVEWLAGTLTVRNDAASYGGAIVNSGLWEIQADLTMQQFTPNNYASLQNNGTLRKAAGSGTATLDLVFVNQGTIEQLSGVLTFGRNFSLTSGTVLFGIAGNSTFGRINLTGTASLAGRLAARLLNGYVPPVSNLFQVMSYGVVAGSFSDYSGLDVGSGRAFAAIYSTNSLTLQTYATNSVNAPIVLLHPATTTNKLFTFQFTGNPGTTYTVQYSTNSTKSWNTLLVTNIPVSPATVVDPTPPKGTRLYRVFRSVSAPIMLLHPAVTNNQFTFQFTGNPGTTYTVQYSTNSTKSWDTLLVTNIPVSPATVVDPTPPKRTRLYRVFR